jgi:hypothetical protein|tara:strand:- start:485 stop:682 length:198 start_codon:yes stop_codon:yes gene_type:complete
MSKNLTIRFEHLNLQSIEGQLLMAACRMQTNSTEIDRMDEYLAQLQEVHDELCFTKELNKVIKDV